MSKDIIEGSAKDVSTFQNLKRKLAYGISNFGNPFTLLFILTAYASFHFLPYSGAMRIILIFVLFAFVPTALFIVINVRRGKYSNYDVSTKAQRPSLYIFSISLMTFVTLMLFLMSNVPEFIRFGCLAALVLLSSSFLINVWLKCSLHTCFTVYTAFAFFALNLRMGIAVSVFALLMGWSRLVLSRHTLSEVITGACLGSGVGGLFYWYIS